MHIEPGVLNAAKVLYAHAVAVGTVSAHARGYQERPSDLARTAVAAVFFSLFMEVWHLPVGPSELHFVGASAIYFTFGFLPTLFGFAIGLALQGLVFEPQDLIHLGVNSLSLMVPLIAVHALIGRRLFAGKGRSVTLGGILHFDGLYYTGVVSMVGFWIMLSNDPAGLMDWAVFAASYLPLMVLEPCFTWVTLKQLKRQESVPVVSALTAINRLSLA